MSPACQPLDDIARSLLEHFQRPEKEGDTAQGTHAGGPDSHLKRHGGVAALMLFPERECQAWARRLRARNFGEDADAIEKDYAAFVTTAAEFDKQLCVRAGACNEWRLGRRNKKITEALVKLNSAQENFRTGGAALAHTLQATAESISTEAWATSMFKQVKADCAALQLEELRAKAHFFVNSKIAALKEQYPQAPDCAIEAAARAELIADQSMLLLSMRDLLLPVAGSLDGGDLSPDGSYLLAQAIVLWREFSKDASARAGDCVKLIPSPAPSGDRTIMGHTEKSATLSVLHFCDCHFSLALLLDTKARAPHIPQLGPEEHLELVLADGYSPQAAADFIKNILPPDLVVREFQGKRTGIELELAAISRAAGATQAAGARPMSAAITSTPADDLRIAESLKALEQRKVAELRLYDLQERQRRWIEKARKDGVPAEQSPECNDLAAKIKELVDIGIGPITPAEARVRRINRSMRRAGSVGAGRGWESRMSQGTTEAAQHRLEEALEKHTEPQAIRRTLAEGTEARLAAGDATAKSGAAKVPDKEKGEVPWDDKAEGYVSGKDAIKLSDGALDYRKLNTLLKPKGEVRYMRKGQRCRVHVNDLKTALERRAGTQGFSEQAAGAFARYQEEFAKKHDRK